MVDFVGEGEAIHKGHGIPEKRILFFDAGSLLNIDANGSVFFLQFCVLERSI